MSCCIPTVKCTEPTRYAVSWNGSWHLLVCIKHVDVGIRWALGLGPVNPPSLAKVVEVCLIENWKEKQGR